jgi:hypothetical protein
MALKDRDIQGGARYPVVGNVDAELNVGGNPVSAGNPVPVTTVAADDWEILQNRNATADSNDKTFTLPLGYQYHILSIHVIYVAGAGADRQVQVDFRDSSNNVFFEIRPQVVVPASTTYIFSIGPSMADDFGIRDAEYVSVAMPPTMIMNAAENIRVYDNNAVLATDDMTVVIRYGRK